MKKAMVYVIALTLALSAMLAGCGEKRGTDGGTNAPKETAQQTMTPETMMPDPDDGVVRDRDGIITDGDSGNAGSTSSKAPESNANPAAGSGTQGGGSSSTKSNGAGKR